MLCTATHRLLLAIYFSPNPNREYVHSEAAGHVRRLQRKVLSGVVFPIRYHEHDLVDNKIEGVVWLGRQKKLLVRVVPLTVDALIHYYIVGTSRCYIGEGRFTAA